MSVLWGVYGVLSGLTSITFISISVAQHASSVSVRLPDACLQDEDDNEFDSDGFKVELALLLASAGKSLEEIIDMGDEEKAKHADVIFKDKAISAGKMKTFTDKWAGTEAAEECTTKKARIAWCLEKLASVA